MSRRLTAVLLCLGLVFVGCSAPPPEEGDTEAAEEEAPSADEIPFREDELDRDQYSKPQELYDFLGIDSGDHVADVMAGSGYNTFLLAERVGPDGHVYAEGASEGLEARLERGDLSDAGNVSIVEGVAEIPDGTLDAVVMVRAYHLFEDYESLLADTKGALKPGGVVGVVEVRLNEPRGHDMTSHRLGEQTVIEQFEEGGFELVEQSDLLRREGDDYSIYRAGERHMTDRMLLKFRNPEGDDG